MTRVQIPHGYTPRFYQAPKWRAWELGCRRFVKCHHRRSGKDLDDWNFMIARACERVGNYWHAFPTYAQAKKAIWEGMDRNGRRFLDYIPPEIVAHTDNSALSKELVNGSIIRLVGTDNINSLMGAGPVGINFSEYALQRPAAWEFIIPMLGENDGWAAFNGTPRGENHFFDLVQSAGDDPKWYCSVLGIDDTHVVPPSVIEDARAAGMSEELIAQEYYVDFMASNSGTYYGRLMKALREDGRIGDVPCEPLLPVHTAWDLGVGDSTVIWFWQELGEGRKAERRYIDYYENDGEGLPHYATVLNARAAELGYKYGVHWAPHDIRVRELGSGKSRLETARDLGIRFEVVKQHGLADGIEAVRSVLPSCWFDAVKCKEGVAALKSYHKEFDEKRRCYRSQPEHDWSSHPADSMRYSCMAARRTLEVSY